MSSSIYDVCSRLANSLSQSEDRNYLNAILISPAVNKKYQSSKIKNIEPLELVDGVFEKLVSLKKKSKQSSLEIIVASASKGSTSAERDKLTYTQLRTTIHRELNRLLSQKDAGSLVYWKIRKELKGLVEEGLVEKLLIIFYQIKGLGPIASNYYNIDEIVDLLHWPTCLGKDKGFVMPSPKQVRKKVLDILERTRSYLCADDFVDILVKGFSINRSEVSFSATERTSNDLENEASREVENEGVFHSFSIKQVDEVIERLLHEIVEKDKGVPLEPRLPGNKGRMGKHFLDFFLWNGLRIKETGKTFGLTEYRKISNLSQTQGSHYKKEILKLTVFQECKKNLINGSVMVEAIKKLRIKFSHRKPKFIEDPYSYYD